MQIVEAAVLGILQGLTEFLPISSSAHLILLPWLMNWQHLGLTFDVMVHGGTLGAILIYFHREWMQMMAAFLKRLKGEGPSSEADLGLAVVVGTLPAILVALSFRSLVETSARSPAVTAVTLSSFALLLWWADCRGKGTRSLGQLTPKLGLLVGLGQAFALVPGVSRSGVTITVGLLLGLSRADAARFSFLLAGPIIALACLDDLHQLVFSSGFGTGLGWALAVGVGSAFLTGLLCIRYFLRFLQSRTYFPFVIYRLALAALILVLMLVR